MTRKVGVNLKGMSDDELLYYYADSVATLRVDEEHKKDKAPAWMKKDWIDGKNASHAELLRRMKSPVGSETRDSKAKIRRVVIECLAELFETACASETGVDK